MRYLRYVLLGLLALTALFAGPMPLTAATTFTVDSTGDAVDANPGDGTCATAGAVCTLRAAIEEANHANNPGLDTINFSIAGGGPHTISPGSALPAITDPVIIDGTSEPDFAGTPIVELNGSGAGGSVDGLAIGAGSSTVKGLVINRFSGRGIQLWANGGNTIEGNYIGTDVTGTADLGNGGPGVYIYDAPSNTIGGTATGAGNVISGNWSAGVKMMYAGAMGNLVQGNYIGTDVTGTAALPNTAYGVYIHQGLSNTIGGTTTGAGNIISGNGNTGVFLSGATGTQVQGNYIGTDVTGTADLGNSGNGVYINGAPGNTIGGTAAGAGNVISGNDAYGIYINGAAATGNQVQGNFIGTDVNGTADLGNSIIGVQISGAPSNTIGGTAAGARNVISGNGNTGVYISGSGSTGNVVAGNYIGTDVTGTADLGNFFGVRIQNGASTNTIGGTATGAGNVISGSDSYGVVIGDSGTTGNVVQGNYVGTDATGTADLGNTNVGVIIGTGASDNTIGGVAAGARNVISGNDSVGLVIQQSGTTGNKVEGNYIGTDVTGTADLGNSSGGVYISGAPGNTIGGAAAGAGNVISGNDYDGVSISGTGSVVQGNYIGTDATGTADLGNSTVGVRMYGAYGNTIGGTAAEAGNVISGNGGHGVDISGFGATGNVVQGNYIGTDVNGTADLGNSSYGVFISGTWTSDNTIGGAAAGAGNVISGNDASGVYIAGTNSTGNKVEGNYIGTQADGSSPLGNTSHGIHITSSASDNTIGGAAAGAGNTIAFNGGDGVDVESGTGNLIDPNSIHSNTGLGIDLGTDGVTPNDTGDGDTGANNLQNFPELTSVLVFGSSTEIKGALNSAATTDFTLEFFSNAACDASGNGEGETFVVSSTETTDGSGNVSFTVNVGSAVPIGRFIAATATDPSDNTSEFSECEEVLLDSDGDGEPDATDVCPNDANNDGDSDGICVGSGFLSPKTGDNDNCPNTPNAGQENNVHPLTPEGDHCEDPEPDGVFDITDNCPDWPNPGQGLPPWAIGATDPDCDGFDTTTENWVGTLPATQCPATTDANDEDPDAWATDNNDDTWSKLDDVLRYIPVFNTLGPLSPAEKRFDLNADGKIALADVLKFIPFFNRQCT